MCRRLLVAIGVLLVAIGVALLAFGATLAETSTVLGLISGQSLQFVGVVPTIVGLVICGLFFFHWLWQNRPWKTTGKPVEAAASVKTGQNAPRAVASAVKKPAPRKSVGRQIREFRYRWIPSVEFKPGIVLTWISWAFVVGTVIGYSFSLILGIIAFLFQLGYQIWFTEFYMDDGVLDDWDEYYLEVARIFGRTMLVYLVAGAVTRDIVVAVILTAAFVVVFKDGFGAGWIPSITQPPNYSRQKSLFIAMMGFVIHLALVAVFLVTIGNAGRLPIEILLVAIFMLVLLLLSTAVWYWYVRRIPAADEQETRPFQDEQDARSGWKSSILRDDDEEFVPDWLLDDDDDEGHIVDEKPVWEVDDDDEAPDDFDRTRPASSSFVRPFTEEPIPESGARVSTRSSFADVVDDLMQIKYIKARRSVVLAGAGITSFQSLARLSSDALKEIFRNGGIMVPHREIEEILKQAREKAVQTAVREVPGAGVPEILRRRPVHVRRIEHQLSELESMTAETAEMLSDTGITVSYLAQATVDEVLKTMRESGLEFDGEADAVSIVQDWIDEARTIVS